MKGQDIVTLILTFCMGFAAGVYLYFTGFAPQFLSLTGFTQEEYAELSIVSEQYGGCDRLQACGSFQLLADGTYSYVAGSFGTGERPVSGTIPRGLMQQLQSALDEEALLRAREPMTMEMCDSYVDGVDAVYEITYEGDIYNLDTCGTALINKPALRTALDNLWMYFTTQ